MVPWTWWPHEDVGHTDEAKKEINNILEKDVDFDTPKPTRLMEQILQIATNPGDLILDSFAGSGTTAHAVLKLNNAIPDKRQRRFILVEMEPNIVRDVTSLRVSRAANGYTNSKGEQIPALGGGFRFCELGHPLFDESGKIRHSVRFADLARHVYFSETGEPLPATATPDSPLLGVHNGTAVYLLYNGILKDKSPDGGNVLTRALFAMLPEHNGQKVIYGTACKIGPEQRRRGGIVFKQLPYKLKTGVL